MSRHAYLIMAHHNFEQLFRLMQFLDSTETDIYLHVDRKAAGYDVSRIRKVCRLSHVFLMPRKKLAWGGSSLTKCEIAMLRKALPGKYDYYHLISGDDIPLRPLTEIHEYFDVKAGEEFISINREATSKPGIYGRIRQYYLFQNLVGRRGTGLNAFVWELQLILVNIQKKLGIDRCRDFSLRLGKGSQWFSVTHRFAEYVVRLYDTELKRRFAFSTASDELLMQTAILNSPEFLLHLSPNGNMRLIDWSRSADGCSPYTFTAEDYDMMMHSGKLWARKVSEDVDGSIIERIYHEIDPLEKSQEA